MSEDTQDDRTHDDRCRKLKLDSGLKRLLTENLLKEYRRATVSGVTPGGIRGDVGIGFTLEDGSTVRLRLTANQAAALKAAIRT